MTSPLQLLQAWLHRQLPGEAADWLEGQATAVAGAQTDRGLFLAVSLVHRRSVRPIFTVRRRHRPPQRRRAPGWRPAGWSLDQAARIFLLLAAGGSPLRFAEGLEQLFVDGGCWRADRVLPRPAALSRTIALCRACRRGVRTNMKAVFEAVAHNNPYPAEQFYEHRWNQMVVKALFIGSTLYPIQGLERRWNPDLTRMLCDYAHERWAAGRSVSYELWRGVGPHADQRRHRRSRSRARTSAVRLNGRPPRLHWRKARTAKPRTFWAATRPWPRPSANGQISWEALAAKHSP